MTFAGSLPTYGRGVTILTSDGYAVTLVHLGSIGVAKGDAVAEGASIGTMGWSGDAEHAVAVPSTSGSASASQAEGYVDPLGLLPPRVGAHRRHRLRRRSPAPVRPPAPATPVAACSTAARGPGVAGSGAYADPGASRARRTRRLRRLLRAPPRPRGGADSLAVHDARAAAPSRRRPRRRPPRRIGVTVRRPRRSDRRGSTGSSTSIPCGGSRADHRGRHGRHRRRRPALPPRRPDRHVPAAPHSGGREGASLASRPSRTPDVGPTAAPVDRADVASSLVGTRRSAVVHGADAAHTERGAIVDPGRRHPRSRDEAADSGRPPVAKMADRATRPVPAHSVDRTARITPRPSGVPVALVLSGRPAARVLAAGVAAPAAPGSRGRGEGRP